MLDERQSFKAAFLARCIEQGHTSEESILERVKSANAGLEFFTKQAMDKSANPLGAMVTNLAGGIGSAAGKGVGRLADVGTAGLLGAGALALAAPPLIGYGLGSAAGSAKNLNDVDIDEIKRQEKIDELRRHTQRLSRQRAKREKAQLSPQRGGFML